MTGAKVPKAVKAATPAADRAAARWGVGRHAAPPPASAVTSAADRDTALVRSAMTYVAGRSDRGEIGKATVAALRNSTIQFCDAVGDVAPAGLGLADFERYLVARAAKLSPATRRREFSDVRGFLRWLVDTGALTRDPSAGVKAPRVPRAVHRALPGDDAQAVLEVCADSRERLIVTLGLQLGLRRMEIAALELGDISLRENTLIVRCGKGGHARLLPLTLAARDAVVAYLAEYRISAGPLIRQLRYPERGIGANYVSRMASRLAYEAGVKVAPGDGVSSHSWRHTAASDVYTKTRDVLAVRDMLGHDSLTSTQVYVKGLDTERLREAMEGRSYRDTSRPAGTRKRGDDANG